MRLNYRTLNTISAALAALLALAWLLAPAQYLMLWSLPYTDATAVIMRRGATLFFTFAVILFLSRDFPPGPERKVVCVSLVAGCVALAIQAIYEILTGHAGPGAWGAVAVEVALAAAYTWTLRRRLA